MDYDVIANVSINFTFPNAGDLQPDESMSMIVHEIIFSIICLCGIIANGIIIHILRHKSTTSPTNLYVINWLISDSLYLILTPCFYRIFSALEDLFIGEEIVCISFEIASILQINSIAFVLVLCANWYNDVFKWLVNGHRVAKVTTLMVWLLSLSLIITFSTFCVRQFYSLFSNYVLFFGFALLTLIVASMHITRVTSRRPNHRLTLLLVTVYVACWFPSWLCLLIAGYIDDYYLLYYLSIVAACLGYLNSLFNCYVFAQQSKPFRMRLRQIFGCVQRDYLDANRAFAEEDDNVDMNCVV